MKFYLPQDDPTCLIIDPETTDNITLVRMGKNHETRVKSWKTLILVAEEALKKLEGKNDVQGNTNKTTNIS